jgi:hypothetical protein
VDDVLLLVCRARGADGSEQKQAARKQGVLFLDVPDYRSNSTQAKARGIFLAGFYF